MRWRIVCVVMEPALLGAVVAAAREAGSLAGGPVETEGFLLPELEDPDPHERFRSALRGADVFLGAVLTLEEPLRRVVQAVREAAPPVVAVFHSPPPAMSLVRMGDGGREALGRAAALWAEGTRPALVALLLHLLNQHPRAGGRLRVPEVPLLPQVALWHPAAGRPFEHLEEYERWYGPYLREAATAGMTGSAEESGAGRGRPAVAVLVHRRWICSEDTAHFAAAIGALERQGLAVYPAYGDLDVTPLVDRYWLPAGVRALLNLTSFNLVGGHGRPRPDVAVEALRRLDVPYLAAVPLIFQSVDQWRASRTGLTASPLVLQVVMPELEGGVEPWVYAGPSSAAGAAAQGGGAMVPVTAEVERVARRVRRWVDLALKPPAERRLAITLFSVPPGLGSLGTAAYLDVFASLLNLLRALRDAGYRVGALPPDPPSLLRAVLGAEEVRHGSGELPVAARVRLADYRRWVPAWQAIARCWGPPPGEHDTDGRDLLIFGRAFGNVFVGVQPSPGYDGDPLRLLFHPDAAPTHAFAAYYAWLEHGWRADALLHFGTHGAMEFMPGKQAGLSADCWPARLTGDLPHVYFYAVNNPSEATIARRRGGAVTVGYRTPPLAEAGLHRTLADLKDALAAFRSAGSDVSREGAWQALLELAGRAHLHEEVPPPSGDPADPAAREDYAGRLAAYLERLAARVITVGLHVAGKPPSEEEVAALLWAAARAERPEWGGRSLPQILGGVGEETARDLVRRLALGDEAGASRQARELGIPGADWEAVATLLLDLRRHVLDDREIPGLLRALDGRYVPPGPGGDPIRTPSVLPAGRNVHAVDPWKIPTPAAVRAGQLAAERLLCRVRERGEDWPQAVGVVLWGSDNIKSGGEGVSQALWLMGAVPEPDGLGRMSRVRLVPCGELGRPRIDVLATCSGIFRDLFPGAIELIAQAARLAALADEPPERNFVRRNALELAVELGIPLEDAAERVFGAAAGLYGTGVNHLVGEGAWQGLQDLARAYTGRMGHAWGRGGGREARTLLEGLLRRTTVTVQNVDSTEVGIGDIDHYFEHLGGLSAAATALRGRAVEAWVVDATLGRAEVQTLREALRVEVRTRLLNPRWYEGLLRHGYQGVHELATRLENAYGWLVTTGTLDGWALDEAADTFLLDPAMRRRLATLNPRAAGRMADRLLEAAHRGLWHTDPARLESLRQVAGELQDAAEGLAPAGAGPAL